ncbi:MAG: PIN domain-containing protein [bacterium]
MKLFIDTSAWLAINDKNDQYHTEAMNKIIEIKNQKIALITSEYIFDESITLIRYRISHSSAVLFGESLLNSNIVKIIDITDKDRFKAWDLFKKYEDKELSFTDCISFVLIKNLKLQKVFTFDSHFKQMGFETF